MSGEHDDDGASPDFVVGFNRPRMSPEVNSSLWVSVVSSCAEYRRRVSVSRLDQGGGVGVWDRWTRTWNLEWRLFT